MRHFRKAIRWVLSVLWLPLPWSLGSLVAQATADADQLFRATVGVGLWVLWGVGLLASLIRRPWSLTTIRLASTGAFAVTVVAAIWAAVDESSDTSAGLASLAIVHVAITAAVALLPEVGNTYVNGLSYGNEHRLLLRSPIALLIGVVPLAWLVVMAGVAAGPLAFASRQWVLAVVLAVTGWLLAALAVRSLHQLALRWVVFVPNGLVLIDALATTEPVRLLRKDTQKIAPTPADEDLAATDLIDLSGNALGVPLLVTLTTEVEVALSAPKSETTERVSVSKVLFSPTRPGAALAQAVERRF